MLEFNKIYNEDCLIGMSKLDDNSVDLVVTSPPYFNLREYSQYDTYEKYLSFIKEVATQIHRVVKSGRFVFWNIQHAIPTKTIDINAERNMLPLSADTEKIFLDCGFNFEGQVIWDKGIAGATQKMFGSYPYPPTMILSFRTEDILVFRKKGKADLSNKSDESKITKEDWVNIGTNLWNFNSVRVTFDGKMDGDIKHSAPFPIELPTNCIKLWSFVNDIVLDPFMGSGTTAIASIKLKRQYIGFEKDETYFKMCEKMIKPYKE
jgi:site-specific DNA-methyltransferase (adenine-specific)